MFSEAFLLIFGTIIVMLIFAEFTQKKIIGIVASVFLLLFGVVLCTDTSGMQVRTGATVSGMLTHLGTSNGTELSDAVNGTTSTNKTMDFSGTAELAANETYIYDKLTFVPGLEFINVVFGYGFVISAIWLLFGYFSTLRNTK